jgi:cytochrome c peroxidase
MWNQKAMQKLALLAVSTYTLFMLGCGFNGSRLTANNGGSTSASAGSGSTGSSGTGGQGGSGQTGNGGNGQGQGGNGQPGDDGGGQGGSGSGRGGPGGKGGHGGEGGDGGERKLASLKTVSIPGPTADQLNNLVLDKQAAIVLGKALFWDMQAGSDGKTACASCHSDAGADNRWVNEINPGFNRVDANFNSSPDATTFQAPFAPNYTLTAADFPLHKVANANDDSSIVLSDNHNVVGSAGVFHFTFNDDILGQGAEDETSVPDSIFSISDGNGGSINTRRVTPRNAPSVINAVFNYRNFWDGRAQNTFNGVNPFGTGDPNASLLQADSSAPNGFTQVQLRLSNSALASQSVGPPGADVEMSATGRPFIKIGKKMLSITTPLALQDVAIDDSVLGSISAAPNHGLTESYADLVKAAFQPQWWDSDAVVDSPGSFLHTGTPQNTGEYSLMEYNFSMIWGVAIQMYESTLVSDNSRFDQFMEGDRTALSALEQRGMDRFTGKGGCANCHNGPELTDAAVSNILSRGVVEQLPGGRWHDVGFHNIGVRPTTDDLGVGAGDPSGLPSLSVAALASQGLATSTSIAAGTPVSVVGAVKTPGLRNIELTAPYFVNGGQATLGQLVDFYSRGGDFPSVDVDPNLKRAGFGPDDTAAVVAFLKSLTDERVRAQSAPFDHPSLIIGNGMGAVDGVIQEQTITLPATGASGGAALPKFCQNIGAACD